MKFLKKIKQYNNVVPQETFVKIPSYLAQPKWALNTSDPGYQGHKKFWGMRLDDEPLFNDEIFSTIKKITKKQLKINKILANAQSSLQDGSPHIDNHNPNTWTFILYCNHSWDYQWGGQTIFFDRYRNKDNETTVVSEDVHNIYPIPNTAVFFPSNMIHYAQGPNRDFYEMRYTIAWHLEEI